MRNTDKPSMLSLDDGRVHVVMRRMGPSVTVELDHVRAAGDIEIAFDHARDGWSVRMWRVRERECGALETTGIKDEVAFLPAFNIEASPEPEPRRDSPEDTGGDRCEGG